MKKISITKRILILGIVQLAFLLMIFLVVVTILYRETKSRIEERKREGCLTVEMECASSLAVAKFRNISFLPFLFGADNLDADTWEPNDLTDYGKAFGNKYMFIALECAIA